MIRDDWKEVYLKDLEEMDNRELLNEFIYVLTPEGIDELYSEDANWRYIECLKVFMKRLTDIGFLQGEENV